MLRSYLRRSAGASFSSSASERTAVGNFSDEYEDTTDGSNFRFFWSGAPKAGPAASRFTPLLPSEGWCTPLVGTMAAAEVGLSLLKAGAAPIDAAATEGGAKLGAAMGAVAVAGAPGKTPGMPIEAGIGN